MSVQNEKKEILFQKIEKLQFQKLDAMVVRGSILELSYVDVSVNVKIQEYLNNLVEPKLVPQYQVCQNLSAAIKIIPYLLWYWEFHNSELVSGTNLWKVALIRKDGSEIRWGKKISRYSGISLCALIFQLHIEEIDKEIENLQKRY